MYNSDSASYFMTYHTNMKGNADYITGLREARRIADNITKTMKAHIKTDAKVFPYRYITIGLSGVKIEFNAYLIIWFLYPFIAEEDKTFIAYKDPHLCPISNYQR